MTSGRSEPRLTDLMVTMTGGTGPGTTTERKSHGKTGSYVNIASLMKTTLLQQASLYWEKKITFTFLRTELHESFAWVCLWQIEVILTNYFSFFGPSGMQKYKQQILLYKKVMNLPFSSLFSFAFLFPRKCIDSNLFYVWYNVFIIINHKWSVIQIKPIKDLFGGGRYHWNDWDCESTVRYICERAPLSRWIVLWNL